MPTYCYWRLVAAEGAVAIETLLWWLSDTLAFRQMMWCCVFNLVLLDAGDVALSTDWLSGVVWFFLGWCEFRWGFLVATYFK